ncbi:hypothetical protein [Actinoplanes sp. GCM10030250]|uniref:hypothetical protein n=1 Tax=Actinoplanes sp. GCM10030250 TaxID=3273376 RepID=UPI00361D636D
MLALYAAIGCLIVLVTNIMPNRRNRTSELDLDLTGRLEGEPVNSDPKATVAAS